MKILTSCIVVFLITFDSHASKKDSVIYETDAVLWTQNLRSGEHTVRNKKEKTKFRKLKYVKRFHSGVQLLDRDNEIFYMNLDFELVDSLVLMPWWCGTVPQYQLTIEETDSSFQVLSDEIFYDKQNIPPAVVSEIGKDAADSICFINMQKEFFYRSTYNEGRLYSTEPDEVIVMKDGRYALLKDLDNWYDLITPERWRAYLVCYENGYKGILGLTQAVYKEVYPFEWNLARVELPNGEFRYVDTDGNVY